MKTRILISLLLMAFAIVYAQAQGPVITVDEKGNGFNGGQPMPWVLGPDPSQPGGPTALIYTLPFALLGQGDVTLLENSPTVISDVIRFYQPPAGGPGLLIFYSDAADGVDEAADISGLPANRIGTQVLLQEGIQGTPYTASKTSDPGYLDSGPAQYTFMSDAPEGVPEGGASLLFLGLGLLGLWGAKRTVHGTK